ncbi:aminodeoxychorismate/anthranilate synthase component II [bacterium]|nr:aminodeoxychorismate/anthranilate synthase component II [bacterium]
MSAGPKILFVDHLDSFSENLVAAFRARGCRVDCVLSAPSGISLIEYGDHDALVLSPGPGLPDHYPESLALLDRWPANRPVLGVCLGHQILLTRDDQPLSLVSQRPVHGRREQVQPVESSSWLSGLNFEGRATFYNSWAVDQLQFAQKECRWRLNAQSAGWAAVVEHKFQPWLGVQYHPESFASEQGCLLLNAFVSLLNSRGIA